MNQATLKTVLKFWQELVFVVCSGLLLLEIGNWALLSHRLDGWDIFVASGMSILFTCLIGQFFWKNRTLAVILSVLLGISSLLVVFMALYGIANSPSYRAESIAMLIIGVVLIIATVKMPAKYYLNDLNKAEVLKT